jgi:hypothetical protein
VVDILLGLAFVFMILAPAIVASIQHFGWEDEDN